MKRWLISLVSALSLVALLVGLLPVYGAWDDNLIFIALDDQPMALSASNMPIIVSNTVYVPYTLFDSNQNGGISFNVYNGGLNQATSTITFYDKSSHNLVFDLTTGLSYDYFPDGELQRPRAIIRNGRIYISAGAFCNYFSEYLHYFYTTTKYDYPLVRIYGNQAKLSDQAFMTSASPSALFNILSTYYSSLNPQVTPSPTPTPSPVSPTAPVAPSPPPIVPPLPVPEDPEEPLPDLTTHLAIRCDQGTGDLTAMLDALARTGRSATLFFAPHQLGDQASLVRRALVDGHRIGLIAQAQEDLDQGNRLLSHIAYTTTNTVLPEEGVVLEENQWLCWNTTLDGRNRTSSNLIRTLESQTTTQWILLDNSEVGQYNLSRLLSTLNQERYHHRPALESDY